MCLSDRLEVIFSRFICLYKKYLCGIQNFLSMETYLLHLNLKVTLEQNAVKAKVDQGKT